MSSRLRAANKYREFINEELGRKSVQRVPGINGLLASRLVTRGYVTANHLLCKLLELCKEYDLFV